MTVPGEVTPPRPGIDVQRATNLAPADIAVVDNIPCTSLARTKLDLAEVVSYRSMERAFDESEVLELFDLRAIEDQLARNPTRPGSAVVKRLLEEHYVGGTLTESELEEAFFALPALSASRAAGQRSGLTWATAGRRSGPTSSGVPSG